MGGRGGGGGEGGRGGFSESKVSCSFCHSIDPDYDQMCKQMVLIFFFHASAVTQTWNKH